MLGICVYYYRHISLLGKITKNVLPFLSKHRDEWRSPMPAGADLLRRTSIWVLLMVLSCLLSANSGWAQNAYVTNSVLAGTVSPIDTSANPPSVGAGIPTGQFPVGVAVTPDEKYAIVTHRGENADGIPDTVVFIDVETNTVVRTLTVGDGASAVAVTPDGELAFVVNEFSDSISVIDIANLELIDAAPATAEIDAISLPDAGIGVTHAPCGILSTLDSSLVYVANFSTSSISVIDTSTLTVANHFEIGTSPKAIAITPDGTKLYITNFNAENVLVIDPATGLPLPTSPINIGTIDGPPKVNERPQQIKVTPDGLRAYVTIDGKQGNKPDFVDVIDTTTDTLVPGMRVTLGTNMAPRGIDITPLGHHAYIVLNGSSQVIVLDTATNSIVHALTAGVSPIGIAIVGSAFLPVPELTAVNPAGGPSSGGTNVTLTGKFFRAGAEISFGGSLASAAEVRSITQVTCITPPGPANAMVDVSVSNQGDGTGTLADAFYYDPPPIPSSIMPNTGNTSGGTSTTILGQFFFPGATVLFGSREATGVTVVDANTITCTAPAGVGMVDVIVTNSDTQTGRIVGGFSYIPPPDIQSIYPEAGPEAGGTDVVISGAGFRSSATVFFGSTLSPSVTFDSTNQLTARSPTGYGEGTVDIMVLNPDGQIDSLTSAFTFMPAPDLTSVVPDLGPEAGGTEVMLTGKDFNPGATVKFATRNAVSTEILSATQIRCFTPSGTGTVSATVTNPDGQFDELTKAFSYLPAPVVTSVSPTSGLQAGGDVITIIGNNFNSTATVSFGPFAAASAVVVSSTEIQATTAPGTGVVGVKVTNSDGQVGLLSGAYTYITTVMVNQVEPAEGPTQGATAVTIGGSGFINGATVEFGSSLASEVVVAGTTEITCLNPAYVKGSVDVKVTIPDSFFSSGILFDGFTYVPPPSVAQISPATGPASGGTIVTIEGSDFDISGAVTVHFGASLSSSTIVDSSSQITAITPPGTDIVDVTVTNGDGQTGTLAAGFQYIAAPAISHISPAAGGANGGTAVEIRGANFRDGAKVYFGGVASSSVVFVDSTLLIAQSPAGIGTVGVTVENPDGQAWSLESTFTYLNAPIVMGVDPGHGPKTGGAYVTITGTGFNGPCSVFIGSTEAAEVSLENPTTIIVTSPAGEGNVDVTVVDAYGQSGTLPGAFTFDVSPVITSLNPSEGPLSGGNTVNILGSGFISGARVVFGAADSSSVTFMSSSRLDVIAPPGIAGEAEVTVINPDGQISNTSIYVYNTPPVVVYSSPNSGPRLGGTEVIINGDNFEPEAVVLFGGFVVLPTTRSSTQLTAITPGVPVGTGTVAVAVRNSDGQTGVSPDNFTFVESGTNSPPDILPIGDRIFDLKEGNLLTFNVKVVDPDNDPIMISATGLPPDAVFDDVTRQFSYRPPYNQAIRDSVFTISFVASDGFLSDTETITLTIINTNGPPVIDQIGNREVTEGKSLNFTVFATDPDDEGQTLTYSARNLPVGFYTVANFNSSTHMFSWSPMPGDLGLYSGVVFAVHDGLAEATKEISIRVNPNRPPVLAPIGDSTFSCSTMLSLVLSATDPDGPQPDNLTYYVEGQLPEGASFDPISRCFEWYPRTGCCKSLTFCVSDGKSVTKETVNFTVQASSNVSSEHWETLQ